MIISVTSLKGGVGKSTIAQNLAVCLAHNGYKVCIVDTDENQSSVHWSGLRSDELPAVPALGTVEGKALSKNIRSLSQNYEIVIIDGTPSLSEIVTKIILLGDLVLIPILPSGLDIWATQKFLQRFEQAKELKEENIPAYFILNQFNKKLNLSQEVREVLEELGIPILDSPLKNRVAYREATIQGLGVFEYKDPKARDEIARLTNELKAIFQTVVPVTQ